MTYLLEQIKNLLESSLDKKDVQYYNIGKPFEVAEAVLIKGFLYLEPLNTTLQSVTTGITDEETHNIKIVLAKTLKSKFIGNAQSEVGQAFLARIMDGRSSNNQLLTNTIRYIIRTNMRALGITQNDIDIAYDTKELDNVPDGTITATLTLSQVDHQYYTLQ